MFREWLKIAEIEESKTSELKLRKVADGFVTPTCLTNDGEYVYISDQIGQIYFLDEKKRKRLCLDLKSTINKLPPTEKGGKPGLNSEYDERGLLSLAFHPQDKSRLFVCYSAPKEDKKNKDIDHDMLISEFSARGGRVDRDSEKVLLRIPEDKFSHNGGKIVFGPEGHLYIATGDGGCCGDKYGNAQSLSSLKGKILRISVNSKDHIPPDNPFLNTKGARPEIWAYGFRNPWQISFDGNRLFVANVGEGEGMGQTGGGWESVFIAKRGGNHGWPIREGTHYLNKDLMEKFRLKPEDFVDPIFEYSHKEIGHAIIGGFVYRGEKLPELKGHYIFGDWSGDMSKTGAGTIHALQPKFGTWSRKSFAYPNGQKHLEHYVIAFGQCPGDELHICMKAAKGLVKKEGVVYQVVKA